MKYSFLKILLRLKKIKFVLGIFIVYYFLPLNYSPSKSNNLTYKKPALKSEKINSELNGEISSFYISNAKWTKIEGKPKNIDKSIIWKKYDFSEENKFESFINVLLLIFLLLMYQK